MKFYLCSECGARLFPESPRCTHCGHPADYPEPTELRCECGFLLCKLTPAFLEIKCRRCKRIVAIPIMELPERYQENKERDADARRPLPTAKQPVRATLRGQYCTVCGQMKPNVLYGKCLDCRTETIKIQYRGRAR